MEIMFCWEILFIIINAISYTVYFIMVKPLMVKYNAIVIIKMDFYNRYCFGASFWMG